MTDEIMDILKEMIHIGETVSKKLNVKRLEPAEIIDSVKENEEKDEEPCTCNARVMCTMASEDSVPVHIVKDGANVEAAGLETLVRTDIELEECFAGCMSEAVRGPEAGGNAGTPACTAAAEDMEGGGWMDHNEGLKVDGEGTLKLESSYMFCTKGFGLIYFESSGQALRSEWEMLEKYVNEDAFRHASSNWDIDGFKEVYGEDIFERMRRQMFDAHITEEASICGFIATIGVESGWGRAVLEDTKGKDFKTKKYTISTRGVGLMQITGPNQKDFITWIEENGLEKDPDMLSKLLELKKGYNDEFTVENQSKNTETVEGRDGKVQNAAEFLSENYALETAIWYWAYQEFDYFEDVDSKEKYSETKITLNEFMVQYSRINSNADNVFLAAQLYVNDQGGWRPQQRQKIASTEDKSVYRVAEAMPEESELEGEARRGWYETAPVLTAEEAGKEQHKDDQTQYGIYFEEDGVFHEGKISQHWGTRYHDWIKLKEMW